MKLRLELWLLLPLLLVAAVASGCKPANPTEAGEKAFQNAPADVKTAWQKASDAAKSNDYAGALILLQELRNRPGLSTEQQNAVEKTSAAVSDKMYEAAGNGDPKAKQALEEIKKARGR